MKPFAPELLRARLLGWGCPGRLLVAYSGGGDSHVLLHALAKIAPGIAAPLLAVHVDHGLQSEADAWVDHCRRTAAKLGVPFLSLRVAARPLAGESLEATARSARYAALAGAMEAGDLLLTAHHQDDQAETLLLQLLRGAGLRGLAAMPEIAPCPPGRLGRPLLHFRRAALRRYAEAEGLRWVEDPSNRDFHRDRNFLRHRILPVLEERWPSYAETLARSARHCAEAQDLIDAQTRVELDRCLGPDARNLSVSRLLALDGSRRRFILRGWLKRQGFGAPSVNHLDRVVGEVLTARPDRNPLVRWQGCEIRRYRDRLFALRPLPPAPSEGQLPWEADSVRLPEGLGVLRISPAPGRGIDPAAWGRAERGVRFRSVSAKCRPAGGDHHRSLKNLFQERGIPSWLRPYVPLVMLGNALVAVGDLWLCEGTWMVPAGGIRIQWEGHPWPDLW